MTNQTILLQQHELPIGTQLTHVEYHNSMSFIFMISREKIKGFTAEILTRLVKIIVNIVKKVVKFFELPVDLSTLFSAPTTGPPHNNIFNIIRIAILSVIKWIGFLCVYFMNGHK